MVLLTCCYLLAMKVLKLLKMQRVQVKVQMQMQMQMLGLLRVQFERP